MWYAELDITPSRVLWASMIRNKAAGLIDNCPSCEAGHFVCVGASAYAIDGLEAEAGSLSDRWVSWLRAPVKGVFPSIEESPRVFRANFYRYGTN